MSIGDILISKGHNRKDLAIVIQRPGTCIGCLLQSGPSCHLKKLGNQTWICDDKERGMDYYFKRFL